MRDRTRPVSFPGLITKPSADPNLPQPTGPEVESARLLANEARDALRAKGLSDTEIDRLAGAFIAEERGTSTEDFVAWAASQAR